MDYSWLTKKILIGLVILGAVVFAMLRLGGGIAAVAGLGHFPMSLIPARIRRFRGSGVGQVGHCLLERRGQLESVALFVRSVASFAKLSEYAASMSLVSAAAFVGVSGLSSTWRMNLPVPCNKRAGSGSAAP
jgi:hypothetical protein